MKTTLYITATFLALMFLAGCEKNEEEIPVPEPTPSEKPGIGEADPGIPEGYFVVTFFSEGQDMTRAAVSGLDGRVRHLRYIIYNSAGQYVKEKVILKTTDPIPTWPLAAVKDTLPKGSYTAVFLANVEKNIFPIPAAGGATTYSDVLLTYKGDMKDARIVLPYAQFTDTSEYYWANVGFTDATPQPNVLLQRIISMLNVHRNLIDAQTALNQLVNNIVTQIHYKDYIKTTVQGLLPGLIRPILESNLLGNVVLTLVGGLDGAVNLVADALLVPVTDALYNLLLQGLVNQIGMALTGNATQSGALAGLGVILNPWATNEANTAIVTINAFPKAMDFNLNVKDYFPDGQRFRCNITGSGAYAEKDVVIKGFHGQFDIRKINVIKQGLISGLLIDQTIDNSLLLNGTLVDINDPLTTTVATNLRYKSDYSFLDLRLKSYAQQTDGNHSLTLSVKLSSIANLDGILGGIPVLGPVLNLTIKGLLGNITVSLPVNLPLLGVDNMELSGSWSPVTTY